VNLKLKFEVLADAGKAGTAGGGPGVGRTVILTAVPLTVPVPLPSNFRIPSTENEWENEFELSSGCRLPLNPAGPDGFDEVPIPEFPGATRHAAVPVKPYDPLRDGESAAALAVQAIAAIEIEKAKVRCIVPSLGFE